MLIKNIKPLSNKCLLCCLLAISAGCAHTPRYARISLPIAETCPQQECEQLCINIRLMGWQTFFKDPTLKWLINLALLSQKCGSSVGLVAQVANTYLIDTELNELICLNLKTIETRQEICRIMQRRFEEGAAPELDLFQAKALLQEAKANLMALQRRRELNWNEMMLLVGTPVCMGNHSLSQIEPCFIEIICPGLPSELLCKCPDWGCVNKKLADALAERVSLSEQVLAQKELLNAQTERARLAWIRFRYSTSPFLEVLEAEREKFSAEQASVQTRRSWLASGINLYIALGGGCCR